MSVDFCAIKSSEPSLDNWIEWTIKYTGNYLW